MGIKTAWYSQSPKILQKLIDLMETHLFELILNHGSTINKYDHTKVLNVFLSIVPKLLSHSTYTDFYEFLSTL